MGTRARLGALRQAEIEDAQPDASRGGGGARVVSD